MAAKLTDAQTAALAALTNLEEQVVYVCQQLDAAQKAWNTANPQFQRTAIALNADFINKTVAIQLALPLETSSFSAASVDEAFPAAPPVAI
jgi:uncharacterized membrane protein